MNRGEMVAPRFLNSGDTGGFTEPRFSSQSLCPAAPHRHALTPPPPSKKKTIFQPAGPVQSVPLWNYLFYLQSGGSHHFSLGQGCLRPYTPHHSFWFKGDMGKACSFYAVSLKYPHFIKPLARQTWCPLLDYKRSLGILKVPLIFFSSF